MNQFTQVDARKLLQPRHGRILIVEDDKDLAEVLADKLSFEGAYVEVANDPYEALNQMSEHHFDLVIMDWELPDLTGGETLKQADRNSMIDPIAADQWNMKKTPVVILSAHKARECRTNKNNTYRVVSYVSKRQPFANIMKHLKEVFTSSLTPTPTLTTAV
jgi:CheY-like chemotaxis protein